MEQENYLETSEYKFILKNASESEVFKSLKDKLKISSEQSEVLIDFIELIEPTPQLLNITTEFPEFSRDCSYFMIIKKKYNINISILAFTSLAFILGFIPYLNLGLSIFELFKGSKKAISSLTEREKAMAIFLKKLSYDGKEELSLVSIHRAFKKYSNINSNLDFQKDINTLLDSLDEKGIIKIKTEKIKILK